MVGSLETIGAAADQFAAVPGAAAQGDVPDIPAILARVLTDVPRYATWERLLGDRIDHSSFEAGLKGLAFAALAATRGAARTAEVLAP